MKRIIRRIMSPLIVLIVLIQLFPTTFVSANEITYFGEAYQDLHSDAQRAAYQLVEEGIAGLAPEIFFPGVNIDDDDLEAVLRAVCVDHPQYFWFLEEGVFYFEPTGVNQKIASFVPRYILDGSTVKASSQELADAMLAFHDKVCQIVSGIPVNYTTEYEVALYLHDYLAEHVTYTLEGEHPSAYAALIHGEAACYGYSKAYQCLLNAAGIRARIITGNSPNGDGELVGHAWNQVWLDGKCYYTDVTWDDFETVTMHAYFAMNLADFRKDHFEDPEFILPGCDHTTLSIYTRNHGLGFAQWNRKTTAAEAAACFLYGKAENGAAAFSCEVRFVDGVFTSWLDLNFKNICRHIGLSEKTKAYYYQLNDTFYLTLMDSKGISPVVSSVKLNADNINLIGVGSRFQLQADVDSDQIWTANLVYTSSDDTIVHVDENGLLTAVSVGNAVITASSTDGSVNTTCSVTVNPAPQHIHTLRMFTNKKPTCTNDGYATYYLCSGCGRRFADADADVEYNKTSELFLPAAHTTLLYFSRAGYHYQRCKCGEELLETKEKHTDADGDGICEVCNLSTAGMFANTPDTNSQVSGMSTWVWPLVIAVVLAGIMVLIVFLIRRRRY